MAGLSGYLGNLLLKASNVKIPFTKDQVSEYIKCKESVEYFVENYINIVSLDKGLVLFDLYPYQRNMLNKFSTKRFVITKMPRQSGKSTTVISYLLWKILFFDSQTVGILAHKGSTARELLSRLKLAYQHLPKWLQQGIVTWNKGDIEIENGSKIIASATSSSAIRGLSMNCLMLDEFAFVPRNIADEFFASVYPTISSGSNTQVIVVSTPNGMNHFYKLWTDAVEGNNDYTPVEVHWSEVPGRDSAWKDQTIRNTSEQQFSQEFEGQFLGGSNSLINPVILRNIPFIKPIESTDSINIFEHEQHKNTYICIVDSARGMNGDYSAFLIIDVTSLPYKVVCKYRSNIVSPAIFPNFIYRACKKYNDAFCLVELNDIGQMIAQTLYSDLAYENVLSTSSDQKRGQQISGGFGRNSQFGVRTTTQTKRIGCSELKTIIESNKLIINDFDVLEELSSFVQSKNSYAGEEGMHDDLVMCLVIFAWLTTQAYYKDLVNINMREVLIAENSKRIEEELSPFGIIDDGSEEFNPQVVDVADF